MYYNNLVWFFVCSECNFEEVLGYFEKVVVLEFESFNYFDIFVEVKFFLGDVEEVIELVK